jgi:hypothetical protein
MADSKLGLAAAKSAARPIQFLQADDRMNVAALDDAIRAQLLHVAIGVGGAASKTVQMLIDLSVWISLETHVESRCNTGVLMVPTQVKRPPEWHELSLWDEAGFAAPVHKSVCTRVYSYKTTHSDTLCSAVGDAFTLRLMFDSFSERQTTKLADLLIHDFGAWHETTMSLREAMEAIRSTLLEPRRHHFVYVPMLYRSAEVCRGWDERIASPASFLHCGEVEEGWAEPNVPRELTNLLATRCETLWKEAAKALHSPEPGEDDVLEQDHDPWTSSEAADDYVCADRMLTFWYGSKRRRRRS